MDLSFQSSHSSRDLSPIISDANKIEFRHLSDVVEKLSIEQGTFVDKFRQTEEMEQMVRRFFLKLHLQG